MKKEEKQKLKSDSKKADWLGKANELTQLNAKMWIEEENK